MPTAPANENLWPHPHRLPLGGGYLGRCTAPSHEGYEPVTEELRDWCNLGYAARCPRMPEQRRGDSNRYRVTETGAQIVIFQCSELRYAPVAQASLRFDAESRACLSPHADACIQRQAECVLESWLHRRSPIPVSGGDAEPQLTPA